MEEIVRDTVRVGLRDPVTGDNIVVAPEACRAELFDVKTLLGPAAEEVLKAWYLDAATTPVPPREPRAESPELI